MDDIIDKKIKSSAYDFLRQNEILKDHIIYLVASGSYGYGTNVGTSDIDLRGVVVESKKHILGLDNFEQFEDRETDTVIYGLKKFINLCLSANPNTLELLGVNDNSIIAISDGGRLLRENASLFLSQRVVQSFGNYAMAQLRRLKNALARDDYPQKEKEQHILNTLSNQMEHFQRVYSKFEDGSISLYLDRSEKPDFDEEIYMDINLKHYPLRDFTNIYSEMTNVVRTYSKLNHRNRKKDMPHLLKHAMHLIRLLMTGRDILQGKGIITYRKEEQSFLLDIRKGKYKFEEIFEFVNRYENEFEQAAKSTNLPVIPDTKKVEEIMYEIYSKYYTSIN
ncbi:MAG TPA: nucleotidyltransferase domain-containing protein [Acetivibrio sp.]|jgi:predicted nucleotidyltransferase|nr:nucleotidyltransferase [Clostridium sp.]HQA57921.1 nucleotidyltransferase domain-containing protein [Acetivibrio sp.]